MLSSLKSSALLALALFVGGCVEDGSTPECGLGGSGNLVSDGCATPVGGSCLDEAAFKKGRPAEREDGERTVTLEDDWVSYQATRPSCEFECMTQADFWEGRSEERRRTETEQNLRDGDSKATWIDLEDDWADYIENRRPDCAP
jgi:hypothetical protein